MQHGLPQSGVEMCAHHHRGRSRSKDEIDHRPVRRIRQIQVAQGDKVGRRLNRQQHARLCQRGRDIALQPHLFLHALRDETGRTAAVFDDEYPLHGFSR